MAASLSDTTKKFGLNPKFEKTETGKRIYKSDSSSIIVVYDPKGDYFRIQDSSIGQRKRSSYLDLDGKSAQNIIENGKTRGRSKAEFEEATHFRNIDNDDKGKKK